MFRQLLLGTTLAAAALTATPLLADPGHRPAQGANRGSETCPAANAPRGERMHGMRQGMQENMHAARGEGRDRGAQGQHTGPHGMQRDMNHMKHNMQGGPGSDGCPMHSERKPA